MSGLSSNIPIISFENLPKIDCGTSLIPIVHEMIKSLLAVSDEEAK
jgi:hypothetical protein